MKSALFLGVLAALLAALAWSLNFIVPLVIGDYSIFDLALPIMLATIGLILVNAGSFGQAALADAPSLSKGIPLAILAAACWVWFGLVNQSALAKRPQMPAGIWTALIMVGASLGIIAFVPIGLSLHVFASPRLGLAWHAASSLYIWGILLALTSSLGGALAWTFASQRLPVAFSAQLITMETVFGVILGLVVRHRWPTTMEAAGMLVLLAGVVITIRISHEPRARVPAGISRYRSLSRD